MQTDQKLDVETFIEAELASADALKTCHASSAGVTGVDFTVGTGTQVDVGRKAVRDNDRRGGWSRSCDILPPGARRISIGRRQSIMSEGRSPFVRQTG